MRIALASMIRPALLAGLLATGSALGIARLTPESRSARVERPATHILVSPHGVEPGAPGTLWLDKETGRTTLVPPLPARSLQHASVSPWLDESGHRQMVGRFAVPPSEPTREAVGLVRATFPEGRLIDLVATETLPVGQPCWFPGTRARVLFSGGDGVLYGHDFEPAGPGTVVTPPAGPRPIEWRCPRPGGADVWLSEPYLSTDPRLARTLVVGLRFKRPGPQGGSLTPCHLWWLRLSPEGDAIEEAGPLTDPASLVQGSDIRSPAVGRTPEGGLAVAYLASENRADWDLMLAPLSIHEAGRPALGPGPATKLAERCRPAFAPGFSADGRWISAVQVDPSGRGTILRLDLADPASADPTTAPLPATSGRPAHSGKWSILVTMIRALLGVEDRP